MKTTALTLAVLALGCSSTGPSEVALDQEFELAPNQSTRIAGTDLTVAFRGVAADNRCPLDAHCVVAGTAGIELDIFGSGTENRVVLGTAPPADRWTDGTYDLVVLELRPMPSAERAIGPEEYRVRLRVSLAAGP